MKEIHGLGERFLVEVEVRGMRLNEAGNAVYTVRPTGACTDYYQYEDETPSFYISEKNILVIGKDI